jgi:hypothetical protein
MRQTKRLRLLAAIAIFGGLTAICGGNASAWASGWVATGTTGNQTIGPVTHDGVNGEAVHSFQYNNVSATCHSGCNGLLGVEAQAADSTQHLVCYAQVTTTGGSAGSNCPSSVRYMQLVLGTLGPS